MNIALIHFRVGETDGVSLEMEKWKLILEKMGHKVWYIAGSGDVEDVLQVPGLHYLNATNELLVDHIYKKIDTGHSEEDIKRIYEEYEKELEKQISDCMIEHKIDLIMPNNILSLGWNIAAGVAVANIIRQTGIKTIAHHHDFYWERVLYSNPKYDWVKEILEESFPVKNDNVRHVVINNLAQGKMKDAKGVDAEIVPNVFDFEQDWMIKDDYNKDIREELGFIEDDVILLQGTRVVARKGIELTIHCISQMNRMLKDQVGKTLYRGKTITEDTKIKLVLVGLNEEPEYLDKLKELAKREFVEMVYVGERIDFERKISKGKKIFSLWDAYQLADMISYPSLLEGFGNQLLEAVYAKKPILLYEYPVFESYLKAFGFEAISFGNTYKEDRHGLADLAPEIKERTAEEVFEILTDKEAYKKTTEANYEICLREFSYKRLEELLSNLVAE
jgi:glycosyltransferase involved in cell wall biosynthesis